MTPAHVEALLQPSLQPETRLTAAAFGQRAAGRPGRRVGAGVHRCGRGDRRRRPRRARHPGAQPHQARRHSRHAGRPRHRHRDRRRHQSRGGGQPRTRPGGRGRLRQRGRRVAGRQSRSPSTATKAKCARAACRCPRGRRTTRPNYANWPTSQGGSARCARMPAATTHDWIATPRPRCAAALASGHTDVVSASPLIAMLAAMRVVTVLDDRT